MDSDAKLYVIVDEALSPGLKIAQGIHAAFAFRAAHPGLTDEWFVDSNNIVVLQHHDVPGIEHDIRSLGYRTAVFREPDVGDAITGIAVEPRAGRLLADLHLAG